MARASKSKSKSKSKSVEAMEVDDAPVPVDVTENGVEGEEEKEDEAAAEGAAEPAGEDDEEEEEEGEYEVESIVDHKQTGGKYTYLVAWKGYGPDHNTWEPEAHVAHAEDIVSNYWKSRPKPSIKNDAPPAKKARTSTAKAAAPAKSARAAGRPKRKTPVEEDDTPGYVETHTSDLQKYLDIQDWEDLVASVDTIERGEDDTLLVYMTMKGGEQGGMATEVANKRCPQKLLKFYEAHLKWKSVN